MKAYVIMMLISLDSGDPNEYRQVIDWGFPLDKGTSNPSSMASTIKKYDGKHGKTPKEVAFNILEETGDIPLSVETLGTPDYNPKNMDAEYFAAEARAIAGWNENFVVKLPSVPEGFAAAKLLKRDIENGKISINYTLVFSRHQGILTGVYGGAYTSPFVGRYDDKLAALQIRNREGMDLVKEILEYFRGVNFGTKVLTASARGLDHVVKASRYGSHMITIPFKMFESFYNGQLAYKDEDGKEHVISGDSAVEFMHVLRNSSRPYSPKNPERPGFNGVFDRSEMNSYELELLDDGVTRFLNDAKSVGYRII